MPNKRTVKTQISLKIQALERAKNKVTDQYSLEPVISYVFPVTYEPRREISNNVVCATSKGSDQPAHTRSLIRAFAGRLDIL